MAGQVNHLRDALADTAYLSGMSEWAASTLHNVRNGLSPINGLAWKLQTLFNPKWLSNLKTAAEQYQSADTPADRREKLGTYLAINSQRVLECGAQTGAISDEIMSASKSVEGIVAEYEKFSRQETQHEAIDLVPLIKDVGTTLISSQASNVLLVLPTETASVVSNRIMIRQIITNLLLSALHAMGGRVEGREIVIELVADGAVSDQLWLFMTHNGEGIAPQHLKTVFQRGNSAPENQGGLGLHWCANAASALGGSLHAESDGPDAGATFVLCLPSSDTALKAAA
jgi:signal transduction histidine kinase